jgi:uncharacterized membrane protein YhhN
MDFRILVSVYFFALAAEIFAHLTGNRQIQYFSKPSLMPILIIYFLVNAGKLAPVKYLIISALAFSWLGDVFLLFDKRYKSFFIYGLAAFLTAHVFYIIYFLRIRAFNRPEKLPNALIFTAIAAYMLVLFAFIAPNVNDLLVPVAIYALVISAMLAASLAAFDFRKQNSGKICVAGTLLFIVSDSILAINRFAAPFEYASVFVMLTYALAQLLITEGSLRNLRKTSPQRHKEHKDFI